MEGQRKESRSTLDLFPALRRHLLPHDHKLFVKWLMRGGKACGIHGQQAVGPLSDHVLRLHPRLKRAPQTAPSLIRRLGRSVKLLMYSRINISELSSDISVYRLTQDQTQTITWLRKSHWSHIVAFGPCAKMAGEWLQTPYGSHMRHILAVEPFGCAQPKCHNVADMALAQTL
ncbi:hypothetical protein DFH06DRAFT_1177476 [Mycena polygramma]|nr:hypothetical protein DFH06DRAFT_1177476 [Mycena polygramma]